MTSDPGNIWRELKRSQLLDESNIPVLAAQFQQASTADEGPAKPVSWLVSEGVLSEYQAEVLEHGFAETLATGNYLVVNRISGDEIGALYQGKHRPTGHPVLLYFLNGNRPQSESDWESMKKACRIWQAIPHPALVPILEVVEIPEYRFVVVDHLEGPLLAEKVPAKTRLSLDRALRNTVHLCQIFSRIHAGDDCHGQLGLDSILFDSSQSMRLLPPFLAGRIRDPSPAPDQHGTGFDSADKSETPLTSEDKHREEARQVFAPEVVADFELRIPASDVYSIGMILHRMLAGKFPRQKSKPGETQKLELADPEKLKFPAELKTLMETMLCTDPGERVADLTQVASRLEELASGKIKPWKEPKASETLLRFRDYVSTWQPQLDREDVAARPPEEPGESQTKSSEEASESEDADTVDSILENQDEPEMARVVRPPRSRQWLFATAISAVLLGLVVVGLVIGYELGKGEQVFSQKGDDSGKSGANGEQPSKNQPRPVAGPVIIHQQELVSDDGQRLWQSPTGGKPIDFRLVPPTARILFSMRMAELGKIEEVQRMLRALGPEWKSQWERLDGILGVSASQIERLTISLHVVENQYQPCLTVKLAEPLAEAELVSAWSTASPLESKQDEAGNTWFVRGTRAFYFSKADSSSDRIEAFVLGNSELLRPVIESRGNTQLDGVLAALSLKTDDDQHFNLLAYQSALFNEEGQQLMPGNWASLNRGLAIQMDHRVPGVRISAHFDEGFYWELGFEQTVDLSTTDLESMVTERLRNSKIEIDRQLSALAPHPYWASIHARFDNMIDLWYRNTRVGTEGTNVLVNGWLPIMAPHNLLAAGETALAAASGGSLPSAGNSGAPAPESLEQLLSTRRTLQNANPPDLNVLLENFAEDIRTDFPRLPFKFSIQINGTELGKEGITRNQRPSALDLREKSIREILTTVMFLANPDKNAKSPKDENCKLVWVIREQNDGSSVIEVTTRAAAKQQDLKLPDEFQ